MLGQTNKVFSIGNLLFSHVSEQEKLEFAQKEEDVFEGYKLMHNRVSIRVV
jgi:hypothetical protein